MALEFVFCPACGTKNKAGSRFCFKCGSPIRVIGQVSPAASTVNAVPPAKPADHDEEVKEGVLHPHPRTDPGPQRRQPPPLTGGEIVITKGRKHYISFSKIAGTKIKLGWVILGIVIFLSVLILAGTPLLNWISNPKACVTPPPCLCNGGTRTPTGTPTGTRTRTPTKTVSPTPMAKAITFEGLWVDEKGGTSDNGMYTPAAEVYFHNGKAYFGFHGESVADLVSNAGGTGVDGGADFILTLTTLTISANGTERQYTVDGTRWGTDDTWLIPDKETDPNNVGRIESVGP